MIPKPSPNIVVLLVASWCIGLGGCEDGKPGYLSTQECVLSYQGVVNFDPALERVIKKTLGEMGIDRPGNIYIEDVRSIGTLDARKLPSNRNPKITSLDNIGCLCNLSRLILPEHQITNIGHVQFLDRLEVLDLSNNDIIYIEALADLSQLKEIYLSNNNIDKITPLAKLDELETLDISFNNVNDIESLSGLTGLRHLNLTFNNIQTFGVLNQLVGLKSLRLSNTSFHDLSVIGDLVDLEVLDLSYNNCEDKSLCSGGTSLDLSQFTRTSLRSLRWLDLSNNQIGANREKDVLAGLSVLKRLKWLDLSSNGLTKVDYLDNLSQVTWLDLSDNLISDINALDDFFQPVLVTDTRTPQTTQKSLNLADNCIRDFSPLRRMTILQRLDISNNPIARPFDLSIEDGGEERFTELSELNLSNLHAGPRMRCANVHTVPVEDARASGDSINLDSIDRLPNLKKLNLSHNQLVGIEPLGGLTKLEELDLRENFISDISYLSTLTNLRKLLLSDNRITRTDVLNNMNNLMDVGMARNNLENLQLARSRELVKLDLSEVDLSGIALWENTLSQLSKLRLLKLSNTHIEDVDELCDLKQLRILHLDQNEIEDIDAMSCFEELIMLDLAENPIDNMENAEEVLAELTELVLIDISCNDYARISVSGSLQQIWGDIVTYFGWEYIISAFEDLITNHEQIKGISVEITEDSTVILAHDYLIVTTDGDSQMIPLLFDKENLVKHDCDGDGIPDYEPDENNSNIGPEGPAVSLRSQIH